MARAAGDPPPPRGGVSAGSRSDCGQLADRVPNELRRELSGPSGIDLRGVLAARAGEVRVEPWTAVTADTARDGDEAIVARTALQQVVLAVAREGPVLLQQEAVVDEQVVVANAVHHVPVTSGGGVGREVVAD